MCGIVGVLRCAASGTTSLGDFGNMLSALKHRGPDDSGVWSDSSDPVLLGHRRLSILDLSQAGHQPMLSHSGRYVIAFNGEIYNHIELRKELGHVTWRGHSDTETLLAGIDAWGFETTLRKSIGMFAIAVWDRLEKSLSLARDRLGEKPLYYGWVRNELVFGSELKAIQAHPRFSNPVERRALALFLRHNCVPAPWSIFESIWKLPPGSWVSFRTDSAVEGQPGDVTPYWTFRETAMAGLQNPLACGEAEAVHELDRLMRQSVAGQMIADVPLGAFLSGGIDSSAVVALMQAQSSRRVQTFTIGFHEREYNEAKYAKTVARHLGTDHTELYVTSAQALEVIPRLPSLYDEPFADSSQIPTFLIAELARRRVTVALSGDGGDELFGGYNRYFWAMRIRRLLVRMPVELRQSFGRLLTTLSPSHWNRLFRLIGAVLPARWRYANYGEKVHKMAPLFSAMRPDAMYRHLVSHWENPDLIIVGGEEPLTPVGDPEAWLGSPDVECEMMYLDSITYLPDDVLVKVDRAAMAVGLETRVPFLDHRVVEFAWRLPLAMKIRNGQGKWILRQLLHQYVPATLIDRPKMGFGVPIDHWLRGPLREWAEELLDESRMIREGYFNPVPIREKWRQHLAGSHNWQHMLWDVLMFQAWLEHQR